MPACSILPHRGSSQQPIALEDILEVLLASRAALMFPQQIPASSFPFPQHAGVLSRGRAQQLSLQSTKARTGHRKRSNSQGKCNTRGYFIQRNQLLTR